MTERSVRCIHCSTRYLYQTSGHGCNSDLNNSRYCPECMIVIGKALQSVSVKFYAEWLPILPNVPPNPITLEQFKIALAEKEAKEIIHSVPFLIGTLGVTARDLEVDGINYRRLIDTTTKEELLLVQYEVNEAREATGHVW
jgi:hypothetical protein